MTLNITVATDRRIYQCADYRLTDFETEQTQDFDTQKVFIVLASRWFASVCFAGVGRTPTLDVSQWLAELVATRHPRDTLDDFIGELTKAEEWLAAVPVKRRRHSFSVGAFSGSRPVVLLVSNYQDLAGTERPIASDNLTVHRFEPTKPTTFVSGHTSSLLRPDRRALAALAGRQHEPQSMFSALFRANKLAASRSRFVSPACFTAYLSNTRAGEGMAHGTGGRQLRPAMPRGDEFDDLVREIAEQHFGPGAQIASRGIAFGKLEQTDDFHATLLREKPADPDVHNNYGAYLLDVKHDEVKAEQAFRRAIELSPVHSLARSNLAGLLAARGDLTEADAAHRIAIEHAAPGQDLPWLKYADFLFEHMPEREFDHVQRGVSSNPESARLFLRLARILIDVKRPLEARRAVEAAREKGADQAESAVLHAYALHLGDVSLDERIQAYRTAIALNSGRADLKLNLAQLLFLRGQRAEAQSLLSNSLRGDLTPSARLEAQVYVLCHTKPLDLRQWAKESTALIARGGRLDWNVDANLASVQRVNPALADLAEVFVRVVQGAGSADELDRAIDKYEGST